MHAHVYICVYIIDVNVHVCMSICIAGDMGCVYIYMHMHTCMRLSSKMCHSAIYYTQAMHQHLRVRGSSAASSAFNACAQVVLLYVYMRDVHGSIDGGSTLTQL